MTTGEALELCALRSKAQRLLRRIRHSNFDIDYDDDLREWAKIVRRIRQIDPTETKGG